LGYRRVNGLVNKADDDLLSATRVACMDLRFAKTVDNFVHHSSSRMFTGQ
jgi:hypothetical protein